jgi:hypothetical protein
VLVRPRESGASVPQMFTLFPGDYTLDVPSVRAVIILFHRHLEVVMVTAQGTAIAGGAIAAALLDLLVEKGILSKVDATTVIERASARLVIFTPQDRGAAQEVISLVAQLIVAHRD